MALKNVPKAEFDAFLAACPPTIVRGILRRGEPTIDAVHDLALGELGPPSLVAQILTWESGARDPEYFVRA